MNQVYRANSVLSRVLQSIVFLYQGIAAVVFIVSLFLAYDWLKAPFIGGFFEHTLVLNGSDTTQSGRQWALYAQGFGLGDQLISVANRRVTSSDDLQDVLGSVGEGQSVPVAIRTSAGELKTTSVIVEPFPLADQIAYVGLPALISFVFLAISLWIFGLRRTESAGRAFSVMTSSLAIVMGSLFDLYTTHRFTYIWTLAVALSGGALIDLALCFPQEVRFVIGRPYLRWLGYVAGTILALHAFGTLFDLENPSAYFDAWRIVYVLTGLSGLFYFGVMTLHAFRSYSPVVKSQARTILFGSLIAFGPIVIWLLLTPLGIPAFNPYLFLFTVFFPAANGYVILRYRLVRTDYWLRQGMVYALLTVLVAVSFGFLVSGIGSVFAIVMPSDNAFLIGGLVFVIAVVLEPLRTWLQRLVDSTFFRGQRAYAERLRTFSHDLTSALDLITIGRALRQQIASSLVPDRIHIYTYDSLNDQYAALADGDGRPTSDIRFSSNSPLVQYFNKENIPLYLDTINPPAILKGDEARLALLGARLFVALPGEDKPVGWLALGVPLSGSVYTPNDLNFLDNLSDQA